MNTFEIHYLRREMRLYILISINKISAVLITCTNTQRDTFAGAKEVTVNSNQAHLQWRAGSLGTPAGGWVGRKHLQHL